MKKYWHENVYPEIPKELVDKVTSHEKNEEMGKGGNNFMKWDKNGYTAYEGIFRKNDKEITVPICRECQVQAPCSKWGGEYPYGRDDGVGEKE